MRELLAEQVFKPGAFPQYTYVSRKSPDLNVDYELRLKQALKISGCLTSIVGPSKMGKTVLCEKVIDLPNLIEVSGGDFNNVNEFWSIIGGKAGLALQGEYGEVQRFNNSSIQKEINKTEKYILNKDKVISHFKENGLVLVLDDFHYAPDQVQQYIAQQLKDVIRREFKAIVISLPHRADDAIRKNADLVGRLSHIDIKPWNVDELKEIAVKGFGELEIAIEDKIAKKIAIESLTSPQLMQYICLSICTLLDSDNKKIENIPEEILEQGFRFTTINFEYKDVIKILKEGPNTRGNKRNIYKTKDNQELDIYGLVIKSIADNAPLMALSLDEIKSRIDKLVVDNEKKPDKQKIKDSLKSLQCIVNEKESIYQVFEWKDNILHILDPLFLFYLRWGIH
jgi:hypothetical protein